MRPAARTAPWSRRALGSCACFASAGRQGGVAVAEASELDAGDLAVPVLRPAGRRAAAKMRQLLSDGADASRPADARGPVQHLARAGRRLARALGRREHGGKRRVRGTAWPQRGRGLRGRLGSGSSASVDAPDHDPVRLDRHLDLAVAGPVLGVDRVVRRPPDRARARSRRRSPWSKVACIAAPARWPRRRRRRARARGACAGAGPGAA